MHPSRDSCLDRTNVAQFSAGVEALEQQLVVMGIRSSAKLDPSSTIIRVLIEMFVDCGDIISLQYGGSEAHKKVSAERTESSIPGPIGKHKELLTSIRRYYSNAFTDRLKQDAMNLLLGYYIPYRHTIPLWEMETDYYLHNLHVKIGRGTMPSMKTYQRAFGVDWSDDEEEPQPDKEYSTTPLTPTAARRAKLERIRSIRRGTSNSRKDNANPKDVQESDLQETWRISQVRRRCNSQNEALGVWWKVAIQSNMQQRMWMQLGNNPSEFMLPPRFERAYQPDKLAQFGKECSVLDHCRFSLSPYLTTSLSQIDSSQGRGPRRLGAPILPVLEQITSLSYLISENQFRDEYRVRITSTKTSKTTASLRLVLVIWRASQKCLVTSPRSIRH
jgi:hypothetical protein